MHKFFNQIITMPFLLIILSIMLANQANAKEWHVQKMSGDVWIETEKPTKVALTKDTVLQNGDKIKTGPNGRVLLKRNKETILVSPNSVIGLPKKSAEKGKTIILQQMGEILLDVEKRNVKHFEVSTPYLVAVVKGTQFRITVDEEGSKVNVLRGKVEVSDFKTGQFVLVKPGQTALVNTSQKQGNASGLILKGAGEKAVIQKGSPKKQRVSPLKSKQFRALKNKSQVTKLNKKNGTVSSAKIKTTKSFKNANKALKIKSPKLKLTNKSLKKSKTNKLSKSRFKKVRVKKMRIGRAIGQVKLNVFKSTNGLSRSNKYANLSNKRQKKKKSKVTFWNKTNGQNNKTISSSVTQGNSVVSNNSNNGNGNGNSGNNGNGNGNSGNNGNGNNGNGNGNGNGNNGNGNGNNGNGNGNNGNGKGNNK